MSPVLPRLLCSQDHVFSLLINDHDHTGAALRGNVVPVEATVRRDLNEHLVMGVNCVNYSTNGRRCRLPTESESVMPFGPERCHHLIVGRFPVLGFFLPDIFNLPVLLFGYGLTGDLLKPVAGILPCLLYTSPSPRD